MGAARVSGQAAAVIAVARRALTQTHQPAAHHLGDRALRLGDPVRGREPRTHISVTAQSGDLSACSSVLSTVRRPLRIEGEGRRSESRVTDRDALARRPAETEMVAELSELSRDARAFGEPEERRPLLPGRRKAAGPPYASGLVSSTPRLMSTVGQRL